MTFSIVIAGIAFVVSSLLIIVTVFAVSTASEIEKDLLRLTGKTITLVNFRFIALVTIWMASGVYLFG